MVQSSQLNGIGAKKKGEGQTIRPSRTHYVPEQVKKEKGSLEDLLSNRSKELTKNCRQRCLYVHNSPQFGSVGALLRLIRF